MPVQIQNDDQNKAIFHSCRRVKQEAVSSVLLAFWKTAGEVTEYKHGVLSFHLVLHV